MIIKRSFFFVMFAMLTILLTAGFGKQMVSADNSSPDKISEATGIEEKAVLSPTGTEYWVACNYLGIKGVVTLRCYSSNIRANSYIQASTSEGSFGNRHMGSAKFTVLNVVPKVGYVDVRVNVEWGTGLPTVLDLTWFNP